MKRRYFASGIEVDNAQHRKILAGLGEKLIQCPSGQPGTPLCILSDYINTCGNKLDISDPLLVNTLHELDLPVEKTYIIFLYPETDNVDPLERSKIVYVYGYYKD